MYVKSIACLALCAAIANAEDNLRGLRGLNGFPGIEAGVGAVGTNQATNQQFAVGFGFDTKDEKGEAGFGGAVNLCNDGQFLTFGIAAGGEGTINQALAGPGAAQFVSPCENIFIPQEYVKPIEVLPTTNPFELAELVENTPPENGIGKSSAQSSFGFDSSQFGSFNIDLDGFSGAFSQDSAGGFIGGATTIQPVRKKKIGTILTVEQIGVEVSESRFQAVNTAGTFEDFDSSGFISADQVFVADGSIFEGAEALNRRALNGFPQFEGGGGLVVGDPDTEQQVSVGLGVDTIFSEDGISGGGGFNLCQDGQILIFTIGAGTGNFGEEAPAGPTAPVLQAPCDEVFIDESGVAFEGLFDFLLDDTLVLGGKDGDRITIDDLNNKGSPIIRGESQFEAASQSITQQQGFFVGSPNEDISLLDATLASGSQSQTLSGSAVSKANFFADVDKDGDFDRVELGRSFDLTSGLSQSAGLNAGFEIGVGVNGGNSANLQVNRNEFFNGFN